MTRRRVQLGLRTNFMWRPATSSKQMNPCEHNLGERKDNWSGGVYLAWVRQIQAGMTLNKWEKIILDPTSCSSEAALTWTQCWEQEEKLTWTPQAVWTRQINADMVLSIKLKKQSRLSYQSGFTASFTNGGTSLDSGRLSGCGFHGRRLPTNEEYPGLHKLSKQRQIYVIMTIEKLIWSLHSLDWFMWMRRWIQKLTWLPQVVAFGKGHPLPALAVINQLITGRWPHQSRNISGLRRRYIS